MKKEQALLDSPITKTYVSYLIPTIIGMITNSIYCIVDVMFVGIFLGSDALAAFNIAMPIFTMFSCFGLMLGVGGATTISVLIGQGEKQNVNKVFSFSVYTSLCIGTIFTVLGLIFLKPLAIMLGATEELLPMVMNYLRPLLFVAFLYILNGTLQIIIRADFNPKIVMTAAICGNLANIFLDWLFVCVLDYGIGGAALATAVGPIIAVSILSFHYILKKNTMHFTTHCLDWQLIKRIFKNGSGTFIFEFSSGAVVYMFNFVLLRTSGNSAVAVYAIISNIAYVGKGIFNGISQASQPLISVNYGAQNYNRVKNSLKIALITSTIFSVSVYILILLFPKQIIGIFILNSPKLIPIGVKASQIYFASFLFTGVNTVLMYYFQSVENIKVTTIIAFLRGIVFTALGLIIFPPIFGEVGVWITIIFSEVVPFLIMLPIKRRADRLMNEKFNLSHEIDEAKCHQKNINCF